MLPTRSILLQASILLLTPLVYSQHYDAELETNDDGEDHSSYHEGHYHPDYSKYYTVDGSTPALSAQLQSGNDGGDGFVSPIDFSNFFSASSIDFGASNNEEVLKPIQKENDDKAGFVNKDDFKGEFSEYDVDGFGQQDYYEQAQKQKNADEENTEQSTFEPKPGPNYVSHSLPVTKSYDDYDYAEKTPKYSSKKKAKNSRDDDVDYKLPYNEDYTPVHKTAPKVNVATYSTHPKKPIKLVGKSSYSPQYYTKYTNVANGATPYQKYSFRPANDNFGLKSSYVQALESTTAPFNPSYSKISSTLPPYEYQPSENVPTHLIGKDCVKVNKEVTDKSARFKRQPMNCFICKDPKSGTQYEQCSYTSEPNPKSYYYSSTTPENNNYRNKRDESESYVDPYEYVKSKSHEYYSKPEEFEADYYKSPSFKSEATNQDYTFDPKLYGGSDAEEKSYSEVQAEELVKNGEHCQKVNRGGMTCTVCNNPKSGGNYEQCSYATAPQETKYAYVREKKYDGKNPPVETVDSTETKPVIKTSTEKFNDLKTERSIEKEQPSSTISSKSKLVDHNPYEIPYDFSESKKKEEKTGGIGLHPALYGGDDSSETTEGGIPPRYAGIDEYHSKLFPEYHQETKQKESIAKNEYFDDEGGHKRDVEKVLEEFAKKDRSNCKQAVGKNGMTCYLCVDKNGIQNEECMFIAESRPQNTHVAYHEVQQLKTPAQSNDTKSATTTNPITTTSKNKLQKQSSVPKKVVTSASDTTSSASNQFETKVKFQPIAASSSHYRVKIPRELSASDTRQAARRTKEPATAESRTKKSKSSEEESQESQESHDSDPTFEVDNEDGLYSAETQPVFSKALGFTLPKYMLVRSEHEDIFDEFRQSSR